MIIMTIYVYMVFVYTCLWCNPNIGYT